MAKKSRNVNRRMEDRIWDDVGREWNRTDYGLTSAAVESLLSRPDVRMCVQDDWSAPLRWVASADRRRVWDELAKHFAEGGDIESGKKGYSNPLPYVASL
jgi:hypothetical protein